MLSFLSETVLLGVPLYVAVFVLVFIIFIGILFDIIGVAVTIQDVTAYTAMASKRIRGAKHSIRLVQNSAMVANICNDVVGDICGIVSGSDGRGRCGVNNNLRRNYRSIDSKCCYISAYSRDNRKRESVGQAYRDEAQPKDSVYGWKVVCAVFQKRRTEKIQCEVMLR